MNDEARWRRLQAEAEKKAKRELLEALLEWTGMGDYIADKIAQHEMGCHTE